MSPRKTGRALIVTQLHGYNYEADVDIIDGLFHAENVCRRLGSGQYRPAADRVWTRSEVREIRWLADRRAA